MLPLLRSDDFIERMGMLKCGLLPWDVALNFPLIEGDRLYVLFSQDPDFSRTKFKHQLAVMRGQVLNLRRALEERKTPEQLLQLPTGNKLYVLFLIYNSLTLRLLSLKKSASVFEGPKVGL